MQISGQLQSQEIQFFSSLCITLLSTKSLPEDNKSHIRMICKEIDWHAKNVSVLLPLCLSVCPSVCLSAFILNY